MISAEMVRDAKEEDVRTAVFNAILVGFAAFSGLSRLTMTFILSLLRLGCNTGLYGRFGSGSMDNGIFYHFARFELGTTMTIQYVHDLYVPW